MILWVPAVDFCFGAAGTGVWDTRDASWTGTSLNIFTNIFQPSLCILESFFFF